MSKPKLIGILGCNFCGSTAMNAMLDCLPNVVSVGETHRIIDPAWNCPSCRNISCPTHANCPDCSPKHRCKKHRSCTECSYEPCKSHGGCRECGDDSCPIFTKELLSQLRALKEPSDCWWELIAESAGVDILVSTDKRPRYYERLGVPDYLLMMVKNVREHVLSFARRGRQRDATSEHYSDDEIRKATQKLVKGYREMILWAREKDLPMKVVAIEDVMADHPKAIREICDSFGIPFTDGPFDYQSQPHHYVAGNFSVKKGKKNREKHSNTRWKDQLSESQQVMITEHPGVQRIANMLRQLDPHCAQMFHAAEPLSH